MTELWLIFAGLLLVAIVIIFFPLIRPHNTEVSLGDKQQNIDIFKQRLAELEQEKTQGRLEEETFLQLKNELEKSLLTDVSTDLEIALKNVPIRPSHWAVTAVISLLVIGVSLGFYFKLGRSDDFALSLSMNAQAASKQTATSEKPAPSFEKIVVMLEKKLQENPADLEKWFLLANTYSAIGKFDKAANAFASAIKQMPKDDPTLAAVTGSYAQMLFQAAGEIVTLETETAMKKALALDPLESSALIIKGIQTYSTGDLKGAITYWEKAKTKASLHLLSSFIDPVLAQTRAKLAKSPVNRKPVDTATAKIEIKLDISPDLKAKTKATDIIFVFAQKVGGRMPLAAERLQVKDLPKTIILDDTKSPMPSAQLSSVEFVDITARVSFAGHPKAMKGDLFITTKKVAVTGSSSIEMIINQTIE